jgi:hypothetical protein
MKDITRFAPAAILALVAVSAAFAATSTMERVYVTTSRQRIVVPMPVQVTVPIISSEYNGTTVALRLKINAYGVPHDIVAVDAPNNMLGEQLAAAVRTWRFTPATTEGHAVAISALLPIRIAESKPDIAAIGASFQAIELADASRK